MGQTRILLPLQAQAVSLRAELQRLSPSTENSQSRSSPTHVVFRGLTVFANQDVLGDLRECHQDPILDRDRRVRARSHRQEAAHSGRLALHKPIASDSDPIRTIYLDQELNKRAVSPEHDAISIQMDFST